MLASKGLTAGRSSSGLARLYRRARLGVLAVSAGILVAAPSAGQEVGFDMQSLVDNLRRTTEVVQGDGIVVAANAVDVSNIVTSVVTAVHFEAEQPVAAGDLLFSLDAVEFELAEKAATAQVARAEARLALADAALERAKRLATSGTASQVVLEEAQAEREIASAEVDLAKVRLQTARLNLGYTAIAAPISGIVGPSTVSVGAYVEAEEGEPLTRIVQLDPILVSYEEPYKEQLEILEVAGALPIEDILSLIRLRLRITDSLSYPYTSKPGRLSSTVDPDSGRITFWAEFDNPGHVLRPGMRVTVISELDTEALDALGTQ